MGKTYKIRRAIEEDEFGVYKKIAIYGDYTTVDFLRDYGRVKTGMKKGQRLHIHVTINSCDNIIEINYLLYQILFLKAINYNFIKVLSVDVEDVFYIEVENTFLETLQAEI
jgi:hypothetical protein